jgi:hypothetical protein
VKVTDPVGVLPAICGWVTVAVMVAVAPLVGVVVLEPPVYEADRTMVASGCSPLAVNIICGELPLPAAAFTVTDTGVDVSALGVKVAVRAQVRPGGRGLVQEPAEKVNAEFPPPLVKKGEARVAGWLPMLVTVRTHGEEFPTLKLSLRMVPEHTGWAPAARF